MGAWCTAWRVLYKPLVSSVDMDFVIRRLSNEFRYLRGTANVSLIYWKILLMFIVIAKPPYISLKIKCIMRELNTMMISDITSFARSSYLEKIFWWRNVSISDNPTDIITKPITVYKVKYCLDLLIVCTSSFWPKTTQFRRIFVL